MTFKILSINSGWFQIDFNRQLILTNSKYLGCDAPKLLLKAIGDLLEETTTTQWLCWQDEPEANIIKLERDFNYLVGEIYYADTDSSRLQHNGISLSNHITDSIYRFKYEIRKFSQLVSSEFSLYENGNGNQVYEKHWGMFPQKEYERLKSLL